MYYLFFEISWLTKSWNRCIKNFVFFPTFPSPIFKLSILTTGIMSLEVEVMKASFASRSSFKLTGRSAILNLPLAFSYRAGYFFSALPECLP
jgi:hypothetical protein